MKTFEAWSSMIKKQTKEKSPKVVETQPKDAMYQL